MFELPDESTAVSLADEATETKCVIHSGEVVKIGRKSYRMPDGSMRGTIKDCKLEVGSSMIFEYTDKKEPQFVNTKPRKKVHEALTIPMPLPDPASSPISIDAHVAEINFTKTIIPNKYDSFDPLIAALLGIAIVSAVVITAVTSFAGAKAAKLKKFTKSKFDQRQRKKQEEQKKCNGKSENLRSYIEELNTIMNYSHIQESLGCEEEKLVQHKIEELNKEMSSIFKKINKLEDELTRVKPKKTTYKKGR